MMAEVLVLMRTAVVYCSTKNTPDAAPGQWGSTGLPCRMMMCLWNKGRMLADKPAARIRTVRQFFLDLVKERFSAGYVCDAPQDMLQYAVHLVYYVLVIFDCPHREKFHGTIQLYPVVLSGLAIQCPLCLLPWKE